MGVFLMHGGRRVCYYSEVFHGEILNFPTYEKELYAMMQDVEWNHYLMGREIVIHTYH